MKFHKAQFIHTIARIVPWIVDWLVRQLIAIIERRVFK